LSDTLLAQLISAKFSHELSGVLGAIKNSMECIENANAPLKDQSFKLAFCASAAAVSRLKFLREIYGYSHPNETFNSDKFKTLITEFFEGRNIKFTIDCSGESLWAQSAYAKLILCILVLCQSNLKSNGIVTMRFDGEDASVQVCGSSLNMPSPSLLRILTHQSSNEGMSVFNVHEHYSRVLADSLKVLIKVESTAEAVLYKLSYCSK
jgi:hypothetical protein